MSNETTIETTATTPKTAANPLPKTAAKRKLKIHRAKFPKVREILDATGTIRFSVDARGHNWTGKPRFTFSVLSEAMGKANEIAAYIDENGKNVIAFDKDIETFKIKFAIHGKSLNDACAFYLEFLNKEVGKNDSKLIADVVNLWINDRSNDKLNVLRLKSVQALNTYGKHVAKELGHIKIKQLTDKDCIDYITRQTIDNTTPSTVTLISRHKVLSNFLNWSLKNKHLDINPLKQVQMAKMPHLLPKHLTTENAINLFETTINVCPSLLPYFALCLFAGIRPYECERLTWKNINMESGEIIIPHTISKTKHDRLQEISENCLQWLKYAKQLDADAPLIPKAIAYWGNSVKKQLDFNWSNDVLRHSFATFYFAKYGNIFKLAYIMGNSCDIVEKHYKRVLAKEFVNDFWQITPDSIIKKTVAA
jgi:integrase